MKMQVRSDDQVYEVEVGDVHTRPIVVTIADERYEVWPEAMHAAAAPQPAAPGREAKVMPLNRPAPPPVPPGTSARPIPLTGGEQTPRYLRAPLPGVVLSVAAQPGQQLASGQEVCVLEAMKMQNTIRAPRAGEVAAVHITVGQHVQHDEALIEYAD